MLTNEILSPAADAAAARYGALIAAWQGIHTQARARADIGSARSFTLAYSQAVNVADTTIATEASLLEDMVDEIALQALADVAAAIGTSAPDSLTEAAHEAASAIYDHLLDELRTQAMRDVAFLSQSLRRHALQIHLASRARRIPLNLAAMQARIGGANGDLDFAMRDRGGNRWPSRRYVRALVRHALLTTYNEIALLALADAGIDRAEVRHLDPKAEVHGMTIAMSPDEDLPTYAEIRDSIFHPNAEALIVAPGAA